MSNKSKYRQAMEDSKRNLQDQAVNPAPSQIKIIKPDPKPLPVIMLDKPHVDNLQQYKMFLNRVSGEPIYILSRNITNITVQIASQGVEFVGDNGNVNIITVKK